jgi:hypothetical protein
MWWNAFYVAALIMMVLFATIDHGFMFWCDVVVAIVMSAALIVPERCVPRCAT